MRYPNFLSLALTFSSSALLAAVTIINHAQYPVYCGQYYVLANLLDSSIGPAERQDLFKLEVNEYKTFENISLKPKHNREIIFSGKESELIQTLSSADYQKMTVHSIGILSGSTFHIAEKDGVLHAYTTFEWQVERPIIDAANKAFESFLSMFKEKFAHHPYAQTVANVTHGAALCTEEKSCIANRIERNHTCIERFLGKTFDKQKTPRIALCCSGGGMRAAIMTYGLLKGIHDIDLLDGLTYVTGLSGSTWLFTDWLLFGRSMDGYYEHFLDALTHVHPFKPSTIAYALWRKFVYGQGLSIVDIYGVYLANTFFRQIQGSKEKQNVTLSDLQSLFTGGERPYLLCTAVETTIDNHWMTFSPFNIECEALKFSMPPWALGRKFVDGFSEDFPPEYSLGYMMGIWGSAGSGSLEEVIDTQSLALNPVLHNSLDTIMTEVGINDVRIAGIKIHNPLYGMQESSYRARSFTDLILVDAGYAYNLPLPPLLKRERAIDIIIVLDASQDVHQGASELVKAISDIQQEGWPCPEIDVNKVLEHPITVFADENKDAPIIVYVTPLRNNTYDPEFDPEKEFQHRYTTTRFVYNKADLDKLAGLISFNISDYKDEITQAIEMAMAKKNRA